MILKNEACAIMRKPGKKGQMYIITALFLCSLVFLLNARTERLEESNVDFASVYSNYIIEAKHVINSAIYLGRNISNDLTNFTDEFMNYAETNGINTYVFYGAAYENTVYLANKLNEPVNITSGSAAGTINFILTASNQSAINRQSWLNAEIAGMDYLFNMSSNKTEVKFVMKMSHENKTEVRMYG